MQKKSPQSERISWISYAVFAFAIVFFSGVFASAKDWTQVLDFSVLNGSFGKIAGEAGKTFTFRGSGGGGARDGFIFAIELMPAVIFALGVIAVVDGLGGLKVAQKIMSPLLKPLMGIPGICGLALIANLQSTDAGAGMIKELVESGDLTDDERTVFATYQISASATVTNYFSSGVALFAFIQVPILLPLIMMFVFKIIGANMIRFYIKATQKKQMPTSLGAGH
ncbi:MAG: nucleoside recognition domain-containing protein [Sporomusaceae bacterium]|nr:nucleoside recognition domain-containing protein [Sporomusaceae bacterium]